MIKNAIRYINSKAVRVTERTVDWCEDHTEDIAFFMTHVVLPAAAGVIVGRHVARKHESDSYEVVIKMDPER